MSEEKHPLMIAHAHNAAMGAWDVQALIGGFQSEKQAREFARRLADLMETEFGFTGAHVQ